MFTGILRYEAVTVSSTAASLTTTKSGGLEPGAALITVEGAPIRFRVDGTDPTASQGHRAQADDVIELHSADEVRKFRAIRESSDATLRVTQFAEYRLP